MNTVYKYKGHEYVVIGECRMKNPITRIWIDAVMYQRVGGEDTFVREKEEFYNRFIRFI